MEASFLGVCLLVMLLLWGISIEAGRKLEARRIIDRLLLQIAHCRCESSPTPEDPSDLLGQKQIQERQAD